MNWANVNLKDSFERSQNILEGYSFDTLLLEISTNLATMDEATISRFFERQLREKIDTARTVFNNNLKNIVADALEWQNLDTPPNKPTSEEWSAVMKAIKDNKGVPHEITKNGEYYFDHFLECLPPLMFSNTYTLCSEPYGGNKAGETTFIGVYLKNEKYFAVIASIREFKELLKS